jgi:hypothetical protein
MDYDPKKVVATFCGVPITGYAKGSFIKIEEAEDGFKKHVGADGEVSRSKVNDDTCNVSINLSQTSKSNVFLSSQYDLDKKTSKGKGPLLIKDLLGATLFFAKVAWIKKRASVDFGEEVGSKEWGFDTGKAAFVNGGNNVV